MTISEIIKTIPKEEVEKLCKNYVLKNIEQFCDIDGLGAIESIHFGNLDYGMDFIINYKSGNSDGYSYGENVLPLCNGNIGALFFMST